MKKGYMIYPHWWETIKKLPREDKGELIEVMMEYINNEIVIDMSFTVELVFTPILEQFKIDNEKYIETCKKRQEAGKKGGIAKAKQKLASATKSYQKKANSSDNDKEKENDKEILSESKTFILENIDKGNITALLLDIFIKLGYTPNESVDDFREWVRTRIFEVYDFNYKEFEIVVMKFYDYWIQESPQKRKNKNWKATFNNSYDLKSLKIK